jgi:proliferating cell nuclear antigen
MLVKLENPTVLSKIIDIISELIMEVRIKIDDTGISISAMDPANVSMVGFKILRRAFSQFETDKQILGINLEDFKRILKRCGAGSNLVLEKTDGSLQIQIQDRIRRNFNLNLIDIESEDIDFSSKVSNMDFSSKVELSSIDFIDSIEDCSVVSDACSFIIEDGRFIIEAKGINSARAEFTGDEAKIEAENCKSRYSLEYLSKFLKGAKLSDKVLLNFSEDHPLKMDLNSGDIELSFVLAPRVETED